MRRGIDPRASGYAAFMSTAADSIHRLHEHRLWTRAKILAAARTCTDAELHRPFEMGMGTLFASVNHLWVAESVWANVLEEGDTAFVHSSANAKLMHRTRDGKTYTTNAHDIFLHVCTHQHYHAAQIANMLRQMGKSLGPTDLIVMAREQF